MRLPTIGHAILVALAAATAHGATVTGTVTDAAGGAMDGALVTARSAQLGRETTVYADASGRFALDLPAAPHHVRGRAFGYREATVSVDAPGDAPVRLVLEAETDPRARAWQLPANRWLALVLERLPDDDAREEFKRQCTYCHQQGSWATRVPRDHTEWRKLLALMARMGGVLTPRMRDIVPATLDAAFADDAYVAALGERFAPPSPPVAAARSAVLTEWDVGTTGSMPHDAAVAPDGRIYAVDMTQDALYRLDPRTGERRTFAMPSADLPLGGVFATRQPIPANANAHVGPHSIQAARDGTIWITLALGNHLARFDPVAETFSLVPLPDGLYPHTLRLDARGRVWYTLAVSNQVGMLDPKTGEHRVVRLPSRTWGQEAAVRLVPWVLRLARWIELDPERAGDGPQLPVPYGIDVAPDGGIWFAQLNERRIGRLDPDTGDVRIVETPFPAPRRLRFDGRGRLWIPSYSGGSVSRFDPQSGEFRTWPLPTEPAGTETPYALNVDRRTDTVWICGTASDTLIRFEPDTERFTVFPLPNRVTYTREIDFDDHGGVWTTNSNLPAWQMERGAPSIIRLEPAGRRAG